MAKDSKGNLGNILFTVGIVLSLVLGVGSAMNFGWADSSLFGLVLVVIGLVVGFSNIGAKEVTPFLIGTVALIIANTVANLGVFDSLIGNVGTFITTSLSAFITVVGAAAVVVSFKAVYGLAK